MSKQVNPKDILVVDDEVLICELLEQLLTEDGHSVATATSGNLAIELCKSRRFDLIFLDYYLPEMTGHQVLSIIRHANPRQPVVLMSGGRPFPPRGTADDLIAKPFTSEAIRDAVAEFA